MTHPFQRRGSTRSMQAMLSLCLSLLPDGTLHAASHAGTLPSGVQVHSVFSDARLGEQPLNGVQVRSDLSPDELVQVFQQHWHQSGSQPIWRDQVAGWTILSRTVRFPYIEVLQVRPDGRGKAQAFLSQADVTSATPEPARARSEQWLPGPFRPLQAFFSRDPARTNTTFLAVTPLPLLRARQVMASHLRDQGLQARAAPQPSDPSATDALAMYAGPGLEVVMTLHEQAGQTLLVLHVSVGRGLDPLRSLPGPTGAVR